MLYNSQDKGELFLSCKDHFLSKETFELRYFRQYGFLSTHPQPSKKELPKYYESSEYLSHNNKKSSIKEIIYSSIQNLNIKRKLKLLERFCPEKGMLLDFGCGTGDFLSTAKKNGWKTQGVEPARMARQNALQKKLKVNSKLSDLAALKYDCITLWHVLEHISDPLTLLSRLNSKLEDKGILLLALPNFKSFDAKLYQSFWAGYDVPRHLWHFSQEALKYLANKGGFEITHIYPMFFDAYYICLLSEKYKQNNMRWLRAFWNATKSNIKAVKTGEYSALTYILQKK